VSNFSEMLQLIVLLGAAAGAIVFLLKATKAAAEFIVRMSAAAHVILYELQPNAGTSIKDRVTSIDVRVAALEAWRREHDS
jgi:hypothetical protein